MNFQYKMGQVNFIQDLRVQMQKTVMQTFVIINAI